MCRLLYVNSAKEFDSKVHLKKFADISKKSKEFQGHGWGCTYLKDGKWEYYKNVNPIWDDDFKKFPSTTRLIAHARSAFKDEGIVVENNMPFYDENFVFIFNGELRGVKIKEEGRIGAEKIFNYIKRFYKGSTKDALGKGAEIINKKTSYIRAMNIILSDKSASYIYSLFNEDENYFTMHIKNEEELVVVCSEPFIGEIGWQQIKNNSLTELICL